MSTIAQWLGYLQMVGGAIAILCLAILWGLDYIKKVQWSTVDAYGGFEQLMAFKRWRDNGGRAMSSATKSVLDTRIEQTASFATADDDERTDRSLARVALAYVEHYVGRSWLVLDRVPSALEEYQDEEPPDSWPDSVDESQWAPKDPRSDLVRAAALLIAEIERLDRMDGA